MKSKLPPAATVCGSGGPIQPLAPGEGVMVNVRTASSAKVALIVWSACTLVNS